MAIGSGVGSQFGMSVETVYGTYVAPSRFLEATNAKATKVKNTAWWDGLAAGRLLDRSDGRVVTTKAATVSISDLKVTNRDIGLLLRLLTGTTTAGAADAGTPVARTYTMPLVDTAGQFATFQSGVPLVGGTVKPQSALGCKVTLKVDRGMKTDQFYAGGAGLKSEPTTNAKVAITGTITADYITAADLA